MRAVARGRPVARPRRPRGIMQYYDAITIRSNQPGAFDGDRSFSDGYSFFVCCADST